MKMYAKAGTTKFVKLIAILCCILTACKKENKTEPPTNTQISAVTGSFEKMTESSTCEAPRVSI